MERLYDLALANSQRIFRATICIILFSIAGLVGPIALAEPAMTLGVATHFAQGWPIGLLKKATALGASAIRDDVSWADGEPRAGQYDFSPRVVGYIRKACDDRVNVLLVIDPRHPDYDGGSMVTTGVGQLAFANYVAALLDRLPPGCISGLEVGNEINSSKEMMGQDSETMIEAYARLLHVLRNAIRLKHPGVMIVGGSTNGIGTGFLNSLLEANGFDAMDAVAVHPYRSIPENVDLEISRLNDAMARHHVSKPIWATEFGDYFATPELAAPHLLKMVLLLSAANVQRAYWYALEDEPWFANMGLYDSAGAEKPAAMAFRLVQKDVLGGSAPKRVDTDNRRSFVFQTASGRYIVWGDPRPIHFERPVEALDSRGMPVPLPVMLSQDPVILPAETRFTLGPSEVLADSLLEYGSGSWSYWARKAEEAPIALTMTDSRWTSTYARSGLEPLTIGASSLTPAGEGNAPTSAVVRYTSPAMQHVLVSACFSKKVGGDGVAIHVTLNNKPVFDSILTQRTVIQHLAVALPPQARLEFAFAAAGRWENEDVSYRIRLISPSSQIEPACIP